ncbi:uncharacterized protein [Halyomorpha halys]|uniref:uncharacterized protein isoform X2 n=1 Tax=Halyomorpha halys TaxID=286706 RepID=UPI0034D1EF18
MTSFVAVNPNNSCDSRVFDQLLFLDKLKQNEIDCEMASSFINSSEFNSILKEFKRKRQQEGDQKKWETFLEKRQQEEVNKTVSGIKATFASNKYQELGYKFGSDSASNGAYCESGTEYTSHWLEDNHMFLGQTFHNYEKNNNNFPMNPYLNESSFSIPNDCQSKALIFAREEHNVKNYPYDDNCNTAKEMQYQYTNFQNEETANDFLNISEKHIVHCDTVNNVLNLPEHKPSHTDKINMNDRKGESILLLERNQAEFHSEEITPQLSSQSEVAARPKKEDNSFSLTGSIEMSTSQKTLNEVIKDESSINEKHSYINEPEETCCKNVAKRIQDIPGVDTELRKVEDIRIKMTPILLNIRIVIAKNINSALSPDEDLERIKQRTLEFGARFKRNYLYRTNCEVNKLKEMMPSPILISKKSKIVLMIQKLTAVHHAAIQALQVIEKQLQTISIFGKTQELLCSFYNCIFELTLILKPFYGYLKTQVLDEVEKHLIETIKLLSELKSEEKFSMPNRTNKEKKGQLKSSIEPPPWMKKSAALARLKFGPPIRVRKRKCQQEHKTNKVLEPKQSKDSINSEQVDNFFLETQKSKALPDVDKKLCSIQRGFPNDNKHEKLQKPPDIKISEPRNVKLICIKSEDDEQKENRGLEIKIIEGEKFSPANEGIVKYDDLLKYRRAFKKHKKNIPLYEKNTLNTVISMSEIFLEETITEVSKEINKMKISDLLGIVDEIETCEPDLDSSI